MLSSTILRKILLLGAVFSGIALSIYAGESTGKKILLELKDVKNNQKAVWDLSKFIGNEKFTIKDDNLKLQVSGYLTGKENNFESKIEIKDISQPSSDRAIQAVIKIKMPGKKWRWWYDPNASTLCKQGKKYFKIDYKGLDDDKSHYKGPGRVVSYKPHFEVDSLGINDRPISIYPYSCVVDAESGKAFTIGVPMDCPRVARICFQQETEYGNLILEVDLGLSPATSKFPSATNFKFYFAALKKNANFRSATKFYYDRFPEFFRPRTKKQGIWTLWMNKKIFAPWDFKVGWNQIELQAEEAKADKKDFKWQPPTYAYTEPWGYYQLFPSKKGYLKPPVSTEDMKKELAVSLAASPKTIDNYIYGIKMKEAAEAVMESAIEVTPDGEWQAKHWAGYGIRSEKDPAKIYKKYGYLHYCMILCNADWELPKPNRGLISFEQELSPLRDKNTQGVQLDSFSAFAGMLADNYRRSHWKYADVPLTYSNLTKKPAQLHYFTAVEYLRDLRRWCDENNKLIGANIYWPWTTYTAHMLDNIGCGECSIKINLNRWYLNLRTLAPKKMISILDYQFLMWNGKPEDYDKEFRSRMEKGLLYAIFPGTGDGWSNSGRVERARKLYREYIPLYTYLGEAGWEPVTQASTNNPRCLIERYGDFASGTMYLALRNYNNDEKIKISLDVKNSKGLEVWDIKRMKKIPSIKTKNGTYIFEAFIKNLETGCFKVCTPENRVSFALAEAKKNFKNIKALTAPERFWGNEPDAAYIRKALANELGNTKLNSTKTLKKIIDKIDTILKNSPKGRSAKSTAWYLSRIKEFNQLLD